jgi:hypothetical protein
VRKNAAGVERRAPKKRVVLSVFGYPVSEPRLRVLSMPDELGLPGWRLTPHARHMMERRGIDAGMVRGVLLDPTQRIGQRSNRQVLQRRMSLGDPPVEYLVRVFVDVTRSPAEVVTVYRRSMIWKYWEAP